MEYKIKVITGFRESQYMVIDANEAHKAYYLFLNPDQRAVFKNGVALIGKNIQHIEPAYNETMGWNPTHELDEDDWNELHLKGVSEKMKYILAQAKDVAYLADEKPELMKKKLSDILKLEKEGPLGKELGEKLRLK